MLGGEFFVGKKEKTKKEVWEESEVTFRGNFVVVWGRQQ